MMLHVKIPLWSPLRDNSMYCTKLPELLRDMKSDRPPISIQPVVPNDSLRWGPWDTHTHTLYNTYNRVGSRHSQQLRDFWMTAALPPSLVRCCAPFTLVHSLSLSHAPRSCLSNTTRHLYIEIDGVCLYKAWPILTPSSLPFLSFIHPLSQHHGFPNK